MFSGYALSQGDTAHPTLPVAVSVKEYAGIIDGHIMGHVLDVNGNPVSNAVVTLWKDGNISSPAGGLDGNPQISRLYSYNYNNGFDGDEGFFQFFAVYPGTYTVTAELEGNNGSTVVSVNNNDTVANITLNGYSVPVLSKEQLAHTGSITGVVLDRNGVILSNVNVSLWQNGRLVRIPHNPQLSLLDGNKFLFENLSQGHYEIMADTMYASLEPYVDETEVDVYDSTVTANITMHNYTYFVMGPVNTPIPSQMTPSDTPKPSPFTDSLFAGSSVVAAALICLYKKKP